MIGRRRYGDEGREEKSGLVGLEVAGSRKQRTSLSFLEIAGSHNRWRACKTMRENTRRVVLTLHVSVHGFAGEGLGNPMNMF